MSGRAGKIRKKQVSRSFRAGVVFPVSRVYRYLKKAILKTRVAVGAPVYLAAVLEYLCAEVLELAGNAARDNKRKLISPRHILLAVANDEELNRLLKGVTISEGGVLPHIPEVLINRKTAIKRKSKHVAPPKPLPPATPTRSLAAVAPRKTTSKGKGPKSPQKKAVAKKAAGGGGGITVLSERTLVLGLKLTVIQGDIAAMAVDAVIHPTNSSFSLSGQCGQALKAVGGSSFEKEVNELAAKQSIDVCDGAISGSGDTLPCKYVIHVHSPSWNTTDAVPNLEKAVKSCLTLAENKNLTTVAFPSIASGANSFPKQTAAQTILQTIRDYFNTAVSSQLQQVYFVLYDMESIGIYTSELARLQD